jgi:hypothetical protein
MKIIEYMLVAGKEGTSGECSLTENVNFFMAKGWELYGSPFHAGLGSYFYQAMVKYQK